MDDKRLSCDKNNKSATDERHQKDSKPFVQKRRDILRKTFTGAMAVGVAKKASWITPVSVGLIVPKDAQALSGTQGTTTQAPAATQTPATQTPATQAPTSPIPTPGTFVTEPPGTPLSTILLTPAPPTTPPPPTSAPS